MQFSDDLRIKITGIRGIYPDVINEQVAYVVARSFVEKLKSDGAPETGVMIVANDSRASGEELQQAVMAGFIDEGYDVYDIGISPLPTLQMAIMESEAVGGIIVTASHNPPEYNGIKMMSELGEFISTDVLEGVATYMSAADEPTIKPVISDEGNIEARHDWAHELHIEALKNISVKGDPLTVALDAVNASGSRIIPNLLKALGCEVIELAGDPTQLFPHTPEPRPQNLAWTKQELEGKEFDLCAVVDPDADRLVLLDEHGAFVTEEASLPLAFQGMLATREAAAGKVAVVNLSTSQMIEDVAREYDVTIERSKVGEVNVVAKMKECDAVFGGEGNGGIIDPEIHYGRDSLVGLTHIINLLRTTGQPLSELVADIDNYVMKKANLDIAGISSTDTLYGKLEAAFPEAQADYTDGLLLRWDGGFVHARESTTEPLFRIMVEEETEKAADAVIEQVIDIVKSLEE